VVLEGPGHNERLVRIRRGFRSSAWRIHAPSFRIFRTASQLGLVALGMCIGASVMAVLDRLPSTQDGVAGAVFFSNCRDAIQAGAAPIYYGYPGYRLPLDADGDGVACEPYRGW
jgi:hypothetical protein